MDFSDDEIRELAAFLARRLTPDFQPTSDAPPEAFDAWERTLIEARSAGGLPKLVRTAARKLPRDPYLREASQLFEPPSRVESLLAGGLMVVAAAVLVLISLAGFATTGVLAAIEASGPDAFALALGTEVPAAEEAAPAEVVPTFVVAAPINRPPGFAGAIAGDDRPDAVAPLVAPDLGVAARVPRVEDGPPEGPLEPLVEDEDRACKVSGWVYAGTDRPPDGLFVVPYALHVRAAPPSKENGWNSRTRTKCWLVKGEVVRLAEPPLELPPGGYFWVHIAGVPGSEVAAADTGR